MKSILIALWRKKIETAGVHRRSKPWFLQNWMHWVGKWAGPYGKIKYILTSFSLRYRLTRHRYSLRMSELGNIKDDIWTFFKFVLQKNNFWTPERDRAAKFWWPMRRSNHWDWDSDGICHIGSTCMLNLHPSLTFEFFGSLMFRASHRSEGRGFDPCLGLRNRVPEVRAWRSYILSFFVKSGH